MNKTFRIIIALLSVLFIMTAVALPAFAAGEETAASEQAQEEEQEAPADTTKVKAIAAAALIAVAATAGAIAMSIAIKSGSDGIARQPESAGNIRTNVMLGLVFIETAIIYALIVAILVIFVL
ncbi:MAG: ATP synthase F0 subunit C [Clostridia bacterium]|nr:ATP synthase F0 subunit C [Clostridia bacterium]